MGDKSAIEWTDATWNPIVGCSVFSPGCARCYAMRQAARIERMQAVTLPHGAVSAYAGTTQPSKAGPVWTGKVARAPDRVLLAPLRWKRPRRIFVNSMGDLFHEAVPDAWIDRVFAVMALCPQHTFQVLTKRSGRMREWMRERTDLLLDADGEGGGPIVEALGVMVARAGLPRDPKRFLSLINPTAGKWPLNNVWLGVSAEDQRRADERVPDLLATSAAVRFVSAEPLLGPIDFRNIPYPSPPEDEGRRGSALDGHEVVGMVGNCVDYIPPLDWIIVGGESGPDARPMHPDWARSIRDQCAAARVQFFFKQWGEWAWADEAMNFDQGTRWAAGLKGRGLQMSCGRTAALVGKARAGRLLDGRTHDAMPGGSHGG